MAVVRLRAPLSELAGGRRELERGGATVGEVLRALAHEHPAIAGWILDEQSTRVAIVAATSAATAARTPRPSEQKRSAFPEPEATVPGVAQPSSRSPSEHSTVAFVAP